MINQEETKQSIRAILEKVNELIKDVNRLKHDSYNACFEIECTTREQKELVKWFEDLNDRAFDSYIALGNVYGLLKDMAK